MLQTGDHIDIWVIECALGQGGMGSVYRCHNRSAKRILAAIKVLDPNLSRVSTAKARFIREAEILFALDHPNIVKVRNVRMDREMPYLEMEFIDGESIESIIRKGPLPARDALPILVQAADAMAYMHGLGIRHRDIKPSNLLLQGGRHLKLVDFGIATEQGGQSITESGQAFGSVSYAPPEWIDPRRLDPVKWDIYSLGVVLFELLTGRLAFPVEREGTSRQQALQVMIAKQDHPVLDPGPSFPDRLRKLVGRMAHPDAAQRLDSAAELKRQLEELRDELVGGEQHEDHREYEILETLGEGGFGTVYRARFLGESGFSKEVALKVLHPDMAENPEVAQRLRDEARMLGLLRHRAVVQVDRLTRLGGRWALVMEYVRGGDLKQVIEANGPLPASCALEICAEVAGALHMAYASPGPDGQPLKLVHRDIKPPNIQLTPFGEVKILDFGIARAEFANREAHTQKLSFGSIGYMAPERLDMTEGPAGDIYSLGAVLYEMLTAEAIGRTAASEKRHRSIMTPLSRKLEELDGVPAELAKLILEMLAYEPAERPSARDVERRCLELRRSLSGEPLRFWTEEVVTPILAERAKRAEAELAERTGEFSGAILREPEGGSPEDREPSTYDPDLTLPDGPPPDPDLTLPDGPAPHGQLGDVGGGQTWYPGVIEDIPQSVSPTMVPGTAFLASLEAAEEAPATPAPEAPPPAEPPRAEPPTPAPPPADPPRAAPPAPRPPEAISSQPSDLQQDEPEEGGRRGLLLAVALLTLALLGVLAWWNSQPPPGPTLRDASLVITGLPADTPAKAWMRGPDGALIEGEADGPNAFVFPGLSPGAWTVLTAQGPEGCGPGVTAPTCKLVETPTQLSEGEGVESLRVALAPPATQALRLSAPQLAERPELQAKVRLRGPLLEAGEAPPAEDLALAVDRDLPLSEGAGALQGLAPGAYALTLVVEGCEPACAPVSLYSTLPYEAAGEVVAEFTELTLPAPGNRNGKPPQSASPGTESSNPGKDPPTEAPPAANSAAASAVTASQFSAWLGKHPEWEKDAAVAEQRADGSYLRGWDGTTPSGGGAMVYVSWEAAKAYCAGRGGLASVDAEPSTWVESDASPWHEYRQADGRPAWRRKDGTTSTSVKRSETSPVIGFRCAR
ncbi:MAG: serine/threonine protein kinase [Alphaproteobacteria bacterium]|nr:serine/threonine protein kinase [Alphaproteobacteria bacterium]